MTKEEEILRRELELGQREQALARREEELGRLERQLEEIRRTKQQLEEENLYLQEQIGGDRKYQEIIGVGKPIQEIYQLISRVAFTDTTVLIQGETGTGKELIARAIHRHSSRKKRLLVKVNCATLPASLIESELFGHERGAFTGATGQHIGKFELANHGTIFLDEIGELSPELQVKLLRVLQEREIERIGGNHAIRIDVRVLAATNRSLLSEVAAGRFRSDLYYRLYVFPITVPPLRERIEDIPHLVLHYIRLYAGKHGKEIKNISQKAMRDLMGYNWPGNVRELEHLIERSILLNQGDVIKKVDLPDGMEKGASAAVSERPVKTMEENEKEYILFVLKRCNGKVFGKGGAAEALNMHVSTLNSRMRKLGIKKEQSYYAGFR